MLNPSSIHQVSLDNTINHFLSHWRDIETPSANPVESYYMQKLVLQSRSLTVTRLIWEEFGGLISNFYDNLEARPPMEISLI